MLQKHDNGILPLESVPFNYIPLKKKEAAFISYDKLVPIYASEKISDDRFKIKLEHSHINIDEMKEVSILE